jgi:predicted DNA binding CopG/RHH family protein
MIMNHITNQTKTLIQIRKSLERGKAGNLAENQAFLDFLQIQKEMTAEFDKTWAVIKQRMEQYDIKSIKGEWGYITLAPRTTFSGVSSRRFMKLALDTDKVKSYYSLYKKLPEGVKMAQTKYLSKRIKAV